jgi:hypothetical protein
MASMTPVAATQMATQSTPQVQGQPILNRSSDMRSSTVRQQPTYLAQAASAIARNSTPIALGAIAIYAAANAPTASADPCTICLASCFVNPNPPACITGCMATYCSGHLASALAALAALAGR